MNKKLICTLIAAVVTICALVSLISTLRLGLLSSRAGTPMPFGMVMLTLVTVFCAVMIWKGVRDME